MPHTSTPAAALLSVAEAIESRHSVRQYLPEPVPQEDLEELIRLTGLAPSAHNLQPWRIVVVRSPELKGALQQAAYGQGQVGSAPAVLVLYTDMADALATVEAVVHPDLPAERRAATTASLRGSFASREDADRERWGAGQGYIALGFLLVAARAMGYDTSPMLGFDAARVKALLDLPPHVEIPAIVALGRAAAPGFPHHRHEVDRITTWR